MTAARTYNRRIDLVPRPGAIDAEMEDTHHHIAARVEHDGAVITDARVTVHRLPWSTCPQARASAASLAGLTIAEARRRASWAPDPSAHCTHMADLLLLAVQHALDPGPTLYHVQMHLRPEAQLTAVLWRDGVPLVTWHLDETGRRVVGPEEWNGLDLGRHAFRTWVEANLDPDRAEAAFILRRAVHIGRGDTIDLDAFRYASDIHTPDGTCHTYAGPIAFTARRNTGSSRWDVPGPEVSATTR